MPMAERNDILIIDQMAVVGMKVYGASDEGVYQLNNRDEWEKISPEVPDKVISLVLIVDSVITYTLVW